jgi:hypothetical protein
MNTTTHLARHMLAFHPNKDAARLCLYHYLIHHCDPNTPLTPLLFENFCRMALCHEHWQSHSHDLSQELQYTLQHYNETFMLDWSMSDFVFPDYWQIVPIKNSIDGIYIFEKWAEKNTEAGSKTRVFFTKDSQYLIVNQDSKNHVTVTNSSPLMLLRKGELQPLSMEIKLYYNENLTLKSNQTHYLKIDTNTYARFRSEQKNITGMFIRGYIFQNQKEINGKINEFPNIYYPLKKTEQYYIDKKSDPDYIELVNVLEKANELLNLNHPEAQSFAVAAFERGQAALENIFVNDNLMQVLVNQLEVQLN